MIFFCIIDLFNYFISILINLVFFPPSGQTYYFSCERWFAVEEEDGKVEREIMVLDHGLGFAKVR